MGSLRFDGVRFSFYSHDHLPVHVHGFYAGVEVIVDIYPDYVQRSRRKNNIKPSNAKVSDVAHIENTAAKHRVELLSIWRRINAASGR